jgi:hypothetical protein
MEIMMEYHAFDDEAPAEGDVKLVLAWTSVLPLAAHFYSFATYRGGKWIENVSQKDLTDVVEYWFDLPKLSNLHYGP